MMCGWQIGQEGEEVADLWAAFNTLAWDGKLKPAPILFPKTLPYGAAVGMAHYADDGRDSIELKANMSRQEKADTLRLSTFRELESLFYLKISFIYDQC